jgi:hypothetical protein
VALANDGTLVTDCERETHGRGHVVAVPLVSIRSRAEQRLTQYRAFERTTTKADNPAPSVNRAMRPLLRAFARLAVLAVAVILLVAGAGNSRAQTRRRPRRFYLERRP